MNTKTITLIFITGVFLLSFASAAETSKIIQTDEYGPVVVTIKQKDTGLFSFISNLFSVTFSKTQVYAGEQVDLQHSISRLSGTCALDFWKVYVVKNGGTTTYLGDFKDDANSLGGCNLEIWVAFATSNPGTYTAKASYRWTGLVTQEDTQSNTLTVLAQQGQGCEYQPWSYFAGITNGYYMWREYKDLDKFDSNPCNDKPNEYKTYCNQGYHITGEADSVVSKSGRLSCTANSQTQECSPGQNQNCYIQNGQGQRTCSSQGNWGSCTATSCNSGYTLQNGQCILGTVNNPDRLSSNLEVLEISVPNTGGLSDLESPGAEQEFKLKIKNRGTTAETINVEAGFYTQQYASQVAGLPTNNLFSALFSTVNNAPNCVGPEPFLKTKQVIINPGETVTVSTYVAPINAYITLPKSTYIMQQVPLVSFIVVYRNCCEKVASGGCAQDTGGMVKDYTGKSIYKTDWDYRVINWGAAAGSENIICGGQVYGTINFGYGDDSLTITRDYKECFQYTYYLENGTVDQNATMNQTLQLTEFKKIAIDASSVGTKTTSALLAAACFEDRECVTDANHTAICQSIASLREEGLISSANQESFLTSAKNTVDATIGGATLGATAGIVACGLAGGLFSGGVLAVPAVTGCASIGALLGAGTGYSVSTGIFSSKEDKLINALSQKDANSVGICIKKSKNGLDFFKTFAWFDVTQDGQKDGVDGLIILVMLIVLAVVIIK